MIFFRGFLVCVCIMASSCFAFGDSAQQMVGKWQCTEVVLTFFGDGMAKDQDRYFQYAFPDEETVVFKYGGNQDFPDEETVVFKYGGNQDETFSLQFSNGQLLLTDEGQNTDVYDPLEDTTSPCVRNLHKLKGAKALFAADNPDESEPILMDLIPAYLPLLPACPDGGSYILNYLGENPACTIKDHFIE